MDRTAIQIHMNYLHEEIGKMQKTAKGLKKMIDEQDPIQEDDVIETLQHLRATTLACIEKKKDEPNELYTKKVELDNN
jgi:hypothetical protein